MTFGKKKVNIESTLDTNGFFGGRVKTTVSQRAVLEFAPI